MKEIKNLNETTLKELLKDLPEMSTPIVGNPRPYISKEEEDFFREMLENRINHCESELKAHINEANNCYNIEIVWKGGHFSVPVWDALIRARSERITFWEGIVWEQIIRQMGREGKLFNSRLWDIASEGCLCGSVQDLEVRE